jgi:hypothetical protein
MPTDDFDRGIYVVRCACVTGTIGTKDGDAEVPLATGVDADPGFRSFAHTLNTFMTSSSSLLRYGSMAFTGCEQSQQSSPYSIAL